jgi:3-deoxy-7-phosphoheptulonate synthase
MEVQMTVVIVLRDNVTQAQRYKIVELASINGVAVRIHTPTLLSTSADVSAVRDALRESSHVLDVAKIPADYPRASRQATLTASRLQIGTLCLGNDEFGVIAGPCSVETRDQLLTTARSVRAAGAHALRGGVFKPRTSPYAFQGLGNSGMDFVTEARQVTGLPFVSEVVDIRDLDVMAETVDVLQIGARNMQNYALLREVGKLRLPVLLKRGLSATVDETLLAAEYILDGGNEQVAICERGIRTFENSYRFTLDLGAVTVFRERTHLPVVVDPSHAAGETARVIPLALAAAAIGADGIIIETHCDPSAALCDGKQALHTSDLPDLMRRLHYAVSAAGRRLVQLRPDRHSLLPTAAEQSSPASLSRNLAS